MIVQMAGLPGTGKSTIAAHLELRLPGHVLLLDKDRIRDVLFGPRHIEYSQAQDEFCVGVMHETAARHLSTHPDAVVILDGRTCSHSYHIRQVQQLATGTRRPLRIIHCVCPDDIARQRLTRDASTGHHPAANRDFGLYLRLKASADPITAKPVLRMSTDNALGECVEQALQFITDGLTHLQGEA